MRSSLFRRGLAVGTMFVAAALSSACSVGSSGSAGRGGPAINQIQVLGTHNSYHRELGVQEAAAYDTLVQTPGAYVASLAYSDASIPLQLSGQRVRALELDLYADPEGGRYANPGVRRLRGVGPLPDPAWLEPGIKVLHELDLDYGTTCVRLVACLQQIRAWSDANPGHVPVFVMLELKDSDPAVVARGGVASVPWDAVQFDELDAEIRQVFPPEKLVTPDDVRAPGLTLEQTVLQRGWPSLRDSLGKVLFMLANGPDVGHLYSAGRPNIEGRAVFTNGTPGEPDAAFVKRDDPIESAAEIPKLVAAGYLVRTRADVPLEQARTGDTAMLQAAVTSGAQVVSTDFPVVGMSARYGSDYVAVLPAGPRVRCNPVNTTPDCGRSGLIARLGG